ncbi:uncharacterized protein LOC131438642 isoform X2 [Malaya genurostris]|nr:uncharacterized protein LOC131438642 isoform X2 [Malaya genurostris]
MRHHLEECKFRPYRCIASKLNILGCNWTGVQHEIEQHLLQDHSVLGQPFSYFQESEIPFSEVKSMGSIKLVDGFSKQFMLYFFSNATTKIVYFMIVYFGRREEAQQYYYEFEIRSRNEQNIRKIKFTEQCVSDCEDLKRFIEEEKCVVASFKTIKHFLHEDSIPFRFILKKLTKDVEPARVERRVSESNSKPVNSKPNHFNQKGKMHTNLTRSSSVGTVAGAGASGGSKNSSKQPPKPPLRKSAVPSNGTKNKPADAYPEQRAEFSAVNRGRTCDPDSPFLHRDPPIQRNDAPPAYGVLIGTNYHYSTLGEYCRLNKLTPPGECKTMACLNRMYIQPHKLTDDWRYYLTKPAFKQ